MTLVGAPHMAFPPPKSACLWHSHELTGMALQPRILPMMHLAYTSPHHLGETVQPYKGVAHV
jgi:hypothetical protein